MKPGFACSSREIFGSGQSSASRSTRVIRRARVSASVCNSRSNCTCSDAINSNDLKQSSLDFVDPSDTNDGRVNAISNSFILPLAQLGGKYTSHNMKASAITWDSAGRSKRGLLHLGGAALKNELALRSVNGTGHGFIGAGVHEDGKQHCRKQQSEKCAIVGGHHQRKHRKQ